jgi:hypothetical protein
MNHPHALLDLVFHEINSFGDNLALCAGFERDKWRNDKLADHVIEWLPEFALNYSELMEMGHHNAVSMTKKAASIVYKTEKYGLRGEFGEILLHIAIRQIYKTIPAVSKIFYKNSVNKTVEGFDAVHVVKKGNELELWIGETKFYDNLDRAIRDVCIEIVDHLETDYLRTEFLLIKNKIDPSWPDATALRALLHENVTLDKVFKRACIPVLLTYDSDVVQNSTQSDQSYIDNIRNEVTAAYTTMRKKLIKEYKARFGQSLPVNIHVILVPLREKKALIMALDTRLKALQV